MVADCVSGRVQRGAPVGGRAVEPLCVSWPVVAAATVGPVALRRTARRPGGQQPRGRTRSRTFRSRTPVGAPRSARGPDACTSGRQHAGAPTSGTVAGSTRPIVPLSRSSLGCDSASVPSIGDWLGTTSGVSWRRRWCRSAGFPCVRWRESAAPQQRHWTAADGAAREPKTSKFSLKCVRERPGPKPGLRAYYRSHRPVRDPMCANHAARLRLPSRQEGNARRA